MPVVEVKAGPSPYPVVVESGVLESAAEHIRPIAGSRRLFVAADEGAWRHQGPRLEKGLEGLDATVLTFQGGEDRKRLSTVESLAEPMHAAGADRSSIVVAFGGGIAGDMGGFLAASYMRGIDVIQVPTTLLAQVDAAVGGKTGVNLVSGKNLFGAFHQPRLVLIDPATLDTLDENEYRAGLFEVVKYGIIWSAHLFTVLRERRDAVMARDPELLEAIITESVRIKADIVAQDEREGGLRRILNYGHTFGHALEAETEYRRLLHGQAVGYGMIAAGRLGESEGLISSEMRRRIEEVILSYGPIPSLEGIQAENLVPRMGGDKKTIQGKMHLVLPKAIGEVTVVTGVATDSILAATRAALDVVNRHAAQPAEAQ